MKIEVESVFSNRATSSWPLSIGTALALESLFTGPDPVYDPDRVIPVRIDITAYQEVWVNLGTLFRNIMGSVSSADQDRAMPGDILDVLEIETDLIDEIITQHSQGTVKVHYYSCDYDDLEKLYPHAKLRAESTTKQILYAQNRDLVINEYHKRHGQQEQIHRFKSLIKAPTKSKAIMISHDALDLISATYFGTLHLLESHTGVLKRQALWYTKYSNGKELARIPFNAAFLQIFGDSQHFHPFPIAVRKRILALSEEFKWTWLTTMDRLKLGVELIEDRELSKQISEMLKSS